MRRTNLNALGFDTLRLEGSLFVADYLEKAATGLASGQNAADYRVPRGLRLNDEYGRAFQIAQAIWSQNEVAPSRLESSVVELFRDALGYSPIDKVAPVAVGERRFPIGHLALEKVPLVIGSPGSDLDASEARFSAEGSGSRKKSPFQMAQEYLNARAGASGDSSGLPGQAPLWAIVTNGERIRLLRASPAMARPSYLEFDLGTIMREKRFPEFTMLWRLLHASRVGVGDGGTVWEAWRQEGENQGTRVREGLKAGVTRALLSLGSGFLRYEGQGNDALRAALNDGSLNREAYFQELLRLIYRFLFVFTIEERGLIHAHPGDETRRAAHELYERGYSLRRLRDKALSRSGYDRHGDQWEGLRVLFRAFGTGEEALDLPALGGLFAPDQCPDIDACGLSNYDLLSAMESLRWAVSGNARTVVDYKNMDSEEFGSVYESLLELVPTVDIHSRNFNLVGIDGEEGSTSANTRKTSGSYYTPDDLVQELIRSSLDPVITSRLGTVSSGSRIEQVKALLNITVVDPACGSGHFLLAAARHLAERLALIRSDDGSVKVNDYRHALREVISHSIYGVDLNPLAVELARMTLWLEGYEPEKPLSFLDHHIRCGNSLIGILDFDQLIRGIPDGAYKAVKDDNPDQAKRYKKRNADEIVKAKVGQTQLFENPIKTAEAGLTALKWKLDVIPADDLNSIEKKKTAYQDLLRSPEYLQIKRACDIYVAAFFCSKTNGSPIPTTADVSFAAAGFPESPASIGVNTSSSSIALQNRFFHWRLEFPEVFSKGGFDCVLGNPPWDLVQAKENDSVSKFHERLKIWYGVNEFEVLKGRRDLYKLFLARLPQFLCSDGISGFVLPVGYLFEDDSQDLRISLSAKGTIARVIHLQNTNKCFFPDVHASYRFVLQVYSREAKARASLTTVIHSHDELSRPTDIVINEGNFEIITGLQRSTALFDSLAIQETHNRLYKSTRALQQLRYSVVAEFHASSDKSILHQHRMSPEDYALVKNSTFHYFNPRFAAAEKFVSEENTKERLEGKGLDPSWLESPRLMFRDIARNDDTRTLICCLHPSGFVSTYDAPMVVKNNMQSWAMDEAVFSTAFLSSYLADFLIRPFVDKHIKAYVLGRIPFPKYLNEPLFQKIVALAKTCIEASWKSTFIYYGSQEQIDIEALFHILIGSTEADITCMMNSFASIRNEEVRKHGSFVAIEKILERISKLKHN